ncbi:hypothetical protein, partial [Enterobacter hormaechei]
AEIGEAGASSVRLGMCGLMPGGASLTRATIATNPYSPQPKPPPAKPNIARAKSVTYKQIPAQHTLTTNSDFGFLL